MHVMQTYSTSPIDQQTLCQNTANQNAAKDSEEGQEMMRRRKGNMIRRSHLRSGLSFYCCLIVSLSPDSWVSSSCNNFFCKHKQSSRLWDKVSLHERAAWLSVVGLEMQTVCHVEATVYTWPHEHFDHITIPQECGACPFSLLFLIPEALWNVNK